MPTAAVTLSCSHPRWLRDEVLLQSLAAGGWEERGFVKAVTKLLSRSEIPHLQQVARCGLTAWALLMLLSWGSEVKASGAAEKRPCCGRRLQCRGSALVCFLGFIF